MYHNQSFDFLENGPLSSYNHPQGDIPGINFDDDQFSIKNGSHSLGLFSDQNPTDCHVSESPYKGQTMLERLLSEPDMPLVENPSAQDLLNAPFLDKNNSENNSFSRNLSSAAHSLFDNDLSLIEEPNNDLQNINLNKIQKKSIQKEKKKAVLKEISGKFLKKNRKKTQKQQKLKKQAQKALKAKKEKTKRYYPEEVYRKEVADWENMTEAQKKKWRRKVNNRIAAQRSRDEKKAKEQAMQNQIQDLMSKIADLEKKDSENQKEIQERDQENLQQKQRIEELESQNSEYGSMPIQSPFSLFGNGGNGQDGGFGKKMDDGKSGMPKTPTTVSSPQPLFGYVNPMFEFPSYSYGNLNSTSANGKTTSSTSGQNSPIFQMGSRQSNGKIDQYIAPNHRGQNRRRASQAAFAFFGVLMMMNMTVMNNQNNQFNTPYPQTQSRIFSQDGNMNQNKFIGLGSNSTIDPGTGLCHRDVQGSDGNPYDREFENKCQIDLGDYPILSNIELLRNHVPRDFSAFDQKKCFKIKQQLQKTEIALQKYAQHKNTPMASQTGFLSEKTEGLKTLESPPQADSPGVPMNFLGRDAGVAAAGPQEKTRLTRNMEKLQNTTNFDYQYCKKQVVGENAQIGDIFVPVSFKFAGSGDRQMENAAADMSQDRKLQLLLAEDSVIDFSYNGRGQVEILKRGLGADSQSLYQLTCHIDSLQYLKAAI